MTFDQLKANSNGEPLSNVNSKWFPGYLSTACELLKLKDININAVDRDGSTPLHRAAEKADDMYYICSKQHSPSHGCSKWYHLTINHKVTFYNIFVKGKLKWWRCWVLMKLVIMSYQLWRSPWSRCKLRCLPWRNPWGTCIWDRGEPGSKKFPFFWFKCVLMIWDVWYRLLITVIQTDTLWYCLIQVCLTWQNQMSGKAHSTEEMLKAET